MRFRPCIDIHNGCVKQIVGSTLSDKDSSAQDNFVSRYGARRYAEMYKEKGLYGGHVIILNPEGSEYYERDLAEVKAALSAYEGGLQIGGGVNAQNAAKFLDMGASHVIVTSFVFSGGQIDLSRLKMLKNAVGKEHIVLDLSCKKRPDGRYYIVTDRWQKFTNVELCRETLEMLSESCAEFLVHAADVEGRQQGIETEAAEILSLSPIPCTYAGGIASMQDIDTLNEIGGTHLDFTVGSALDIFGGELSFEQIARIYR